MLRRIELRDFAVISLAVFTPEYGLNVISGETGAGKSLIIDAINLIMGNKASKDLIRTDKKKAYVEAILDFEYVQETVYRRISEILLESGIEIDKNDDIIISREISNDGRSVARINGKSVVLNTLKLVSSELIDIHGQHDTQSIFNEASHISLLDNFAQDDVLTKLRDYQNCLSEYKEIVTRIKNLGSNTDNINNRKEYLSFAIEQINKAGFKEGEEEILTSRKQSLKLLEKKSTIINQADELLSEDEEGALNNLRRASNLINKLASDNNEYQELASRIETLSLELEAAADEVSVLVSEAGFSEEEINKIDERLSLLYDLKSRYGNSIEEINLFAATASIELEELNDSANLLVKLKASRHEVESKLVALAESLNKSRQQKAQVLSNLIIQELVDLEIPHANFFVEFVERPRQKYFSALGTYDIRFLFSANLGEELKPLSKIASGGEASRIMLAIKTVLSSVDNITTLIFDEIDTGISGKASNMVARKLQKISKSHQVLCVTHTPQIAAAADYNFLSKKTVENNATYASVEILGEEDKVLEVSRLLSGTTDSESLELSRKLISSSKS